MFRKTWKQLKYLVILVVIIICIPRSILPARSQPQDDIAEYIRLNNEEKRLPEYKDDEAALKLKLGQLKVINKSRRRYNAPPVRLDILASRVANRMSREAAENNYTGHWNMAGEKPYHRYAFAGGHDHVTENAYGEWSNVKYDNTPESISELMKAGHESFMAEKAPRDGHKKAIIDKEHTHVGIGFHLAGTQFRYYEEFIDRYLEFENIPGEVKTGTGFTITVRTGESRFLYFLNVYHEDFPSPMTPKEIARKGSYQDYTNTEYFKMMPWELAKLRKGQEYRIPLTLNREGLYYIQIYTDKREYTRPLSFSTKGKVPHSGIVIRAVR